MRKLSLRVITLAAMPTPQLARISNAIAVNFKQFDSYKNSNKKTILQSIFSYSCLSTMSPEYQSLAFQNIFYQQNSLLLHKTVCENKGVLQK